MGANQSNLPKEPKLSILITNIEDTFFIKGGKADILTNLDTDNKCDDFTIISEEKFKRFGENIKYREENKKETIRKFLILVKENDIELSKLDLDSKSKETVCQGLRNFYMQIKNIFNAIKEANGESNICSNLSTIVAVNNNPKSSIDGFDKIIYPCTQGQFSSSSTESLTSFKELYNFKKDPMETTNPNFRAIADYKKAISELNKSIIGADTTGDSESINPYPSPTDCRKIGINSKYNLFIKYKQHTDKLIFQRDINLQVLTDILNRLFKPKLDKDKNIFYILNPDELKKPESLNKITDDTKNAILKLYKDCEEAYNMALVTYQTILQKASNNPEYVKIIVDGDDQLETPPAPQSETKDEASEPVASEPVASEPVASEQAYTEGQIAAEPQPPKLVSKSGGYSKINRKSRKKFKRKSRRKPRRKPRRKSKKDNKRKIKNLRNKSKKSRKNLN